MAISRARMCTNRLQNSIRLQRREIAGFLREGREEGARLKAEHLLREYRLERAMEILVTVCELLISRLSYLATERICPPDLLSPIHSLLYCIDELAAVRKQFAVKYGEALVEAAVKNAKQEVHFKLVHALSLAPPLEFDLQQLLCGIAKEYLISDWKPSIALDASPACDFIPRPSMESNHSRAHPNSPPSFPEVQRQRQLPCRKHGQQGTDSLVAGRLATRQVPGPPSSVEAPVRVPGRRSNGDPKPSPTGANAHQQLVGEAPTCQAHALQSAALHEEEMGFPSLHPPPHAKPTYSGGAASESVLLHKIEYKTTPEQDECILDIDRHCSDARLQEDCVTPLQQEIPLGSWPYPISAVRPAPSSAQLAWQQRNIAEGQVTGPVTHDCTGTSKVSLSLPNPSDSDAVLLKNGFSCIPIPVAAMPAFFPV
ncbi:hypothetical protein, conserved [Eimeria necatrix]|uniref:IST1 homolog n=1 Tax=Eimeria necatrix TaxID=51315 RepID=U6MM30_9EIME|nr:hypothetical protein, conserved [Eimeria necatrix]CDJ65307.1 hypothetical protein, conserved [Eimeria necatrix]